MKFLVIGDFHGKFPVKLKKIARSKEIDFVLCTGDLGGSDKLLKIIFKYFHENWIEIIGEKKANKLILEDYNSGLKIIKELSKTGKNVYIIDGNWDFTTQSSKERIGHLKLSSYKSIIKKSKNLKYWGRGFKVVRDVRILAFGGPVTAGDYLKKGVLKEKSRKKYIKSNQKEIKQIKKHIKKDVDILLSHYTPYGFFDKVKFKGENLMNGKHVGSIALTEFIKGAQPSLSISGHMHEYQGSKRLGKTKIIETGSAKEGKAVIIDWDEDKRKIRKVKFVK